uniref:Zgc:56095 n=1 Tax=Cynoglossus semilaevis TaxID=244447 RepID=A0A3P8WU95_CYNSE
MCELLPPSDRRLVIIQAFQQCYTRTILHWKPRHSPGIPILYKELKKFKIKYKKKTPTNIVFYFIYLCDISVKPSRDDWKGGLDAMSFSLDFQKSLNACILEVHRRADGNTDPHLCDFLEQNFLEDSYDTIKKLGDYNKSLTSITASDTHGSLGEYLFDKHTLSV